MASLLTKFVARLPDHWQSELKRIYFRHQIKRGTFVTPEPEYAILPSLIAEGDWIIDVGANVGHYTKRFSELVGKNGRVLAFEPVPETFALLAANLQNICAANVSLINAALSDTMNIVGISIPYFDSGLPNYYQAHIASSSDNQLKVLTLSLDSLNINNKIALIKIDAEGHECSILRGMYQILNRDHPILIIEANSPVIENSLRNLGYVSEKLDGSPNLIFRQEIEK